MSSFHSVLGEYLGIAQQAQAIQQNKINSQLLQQELALNESIIPLQIEQAQMSNQLAKAQLDEYLKNRGVREEEAQLNLESMRQNINESVTRERDVMLRYDLAERQFAHGQNVDNQNIAMRKEEAKQYAMESSVSRISTLAQVSGVGGMNAILDSFAENPESIEDPVLRGLAKAKREGFVVEDKGGDPTRELVEKAIEFMSPEEKLNYGFDILERPFVDQQASPTEQALAAQMGLAVDGSYGNAAINTARSRIGKDVVPIDNTSGGAFKSELPIRKPISSVPTSQTNPKDIVSSLEDSAVDLISLESLRNKISKSARKTQGQVPNVPIGIGPALGGQPYTMREGTVVEPSATTTRRILSQTSNKFTNYVNNAFSGDELRIFKDASAFAKEGGKFVTSDGQEKNLRLNTSQQISFKAALLQIAKARRDPKVLSSVMSDILKINPNLTQDAIDYLDEVITRINAL